MGVCWETDQRFLMGIKAPMASKGTVKPLAFRGSAASFQTMMRLDWLGNLPSHNIILGSIVIRNRLSPIHLNSKKGLTLNSRNSEVIKMSLSRMIQRKALSKSQATSPDLHRSCHKVDPSIPGKDHPSTWEEEPHLTCKEGIKINSLKILKTKGDFKLYSATSRFLTLSLQIIWTLLSHSRISIQEWIQSLPSQDQPLLHVKLKNLLPPRSQTP